ncbi:MAG: RES family NAD+ phosphorylase [Bryobacteraceae bacterium]
MIITSRLCRPTYSKLDGVGGLYRAGRWHEQGNRVVYVSASEALAALEVLVHLSSVTQFPEYVCVKAAIPEDLVFDIGNDLPRDWKTTRSAEAQALGTRWLHERRSAVLRVPSAVIPRESNYLINPEHADFRKISVQAPLPFEFDLRLLGGPASTVDDADAT